MSLRLTAARQSASVLVLTGCGGERNCRGDPGRCKAPARAFRTLYNNGWWSTAPNTKRACGLSVGRQRSGVKSVVDHTVDFGASDAAMKPDDMAKVQGGVQLFPMTAGSIVLAYNLKGVDNLKLSRAAYGALFLGNVKRWNDPLIAQANPGVTLPDLPINVVVRADSSGTSFVFSQHLSAISAEFSKGVGANTMPNWQVGTKSKGNEGVTASIMTTPGSIGSIEYGYAKSQKVPMAVRENKAGKHVAASTESGRAARVRPAPDDMIRVGVGSRRGGGLPDCHLHLDDLLQEVHRQEQAAGDAGTAQVRFDRRSERRGGAGVHPASSRRRRESDNRNPKPLGGVAGRSGSSWPCRLPRASKSLQERCSKRDRERSPKRPLGDNS